MLKAAVENAAFTVGPPAPSFWHTRHQQVRVVIGSALMM
jgi:hypothetical protein